MGRWWIQTALLTTFILGASVVLLGQQQADRKPPAFEVASVKPNKSGDDRSYAIIHPGGRYSVTNTSVKGLVLASYHLDLNRVFGGSSWIETDRFDIEAKAPGGIKPTQEQLNDMVKVLLADRFQLRAHKESRQLPVYTLERATNRAVGPRLRRASSANCVNLPEASPDKGPRPTTSANGQPWCGRMVFGPTGWLGRSVTTEQIAKALEPFLGRFVLDHTNIRGMFDVDLDFNPRPLASPANDDAGISVFTAVQEQLGLKLESTKAPAEVLVIDHAERPTPD